MSLLAAIAGGEELLRKIGILYECKYSHPLPRPGGKLVSLFLNPLKYKMRKDSC